MRAQKGGARAESGRRLAGLILFVLLVAGNTHGVGAQPGSAWGNPAPAVVGSPVRPQGRLPPGKSITRELLAGDLHGFELALVPARFLRVDLNSSSADLMVILVWPGGRRRLEWCIPRRAVTPVAWIADLEGTYELQVRGLGKETDSGLYTIQLKAQRPASPGDEGQVAGCRALSNATQLRRAWTQSSLNRSIAEYTRALKCWQASADRTQQAAALKSLGDVWEILSDRHKALACYRRARALWVELEDRAGLAATSNALAAFYIYRGEYQKALELRGPKPETGDPWDRAQTLHNLGAVYHGTNELPKAEASLSEALRIREGLRDRPGQAETLRYLGYVNHALKNVPQAGQFYRRSLELSRETEDLRGVALALTALGHLSNITGESRQALDYYDQAESIFRAIGELDGQCTVLEGMALLYSVLGEHQKALRSCLQALALARQVKDLVAEADTSDFISEVYRELGDYANALQYARQAVLLNRSIPSILGESYALLDLGKVLEAQGSRKDAMHTYQRALELSRKGGDPFLEGSLLNAIGHLHHGLGELSQALEYYRRAIDLQQAANDNVRLPGTLYNLARAERDRGNLRDALRYSERAVGTIESLRGKVAGAELRRSFLASVHEQYELLIDVLMSLHAQHPSAGFDAGALQASERARARSLMDSLLELREEIRKGVDPELLARERELESSLRVKADQQTRVLSGKHTQDEAALLANEVEKLSAEYDHVQALIRGRSPQYAALTHPQPLTPRQIQSEVLEEDTLLLEYSLGEERSYLWAVTSGALLSFALPGRAEIEAATRRILASLLSREPNAGETVRQYRQRVRVAEQQFSREINAASRVLLGPVFPHLRNRRLVIVSDGALQLLPFGLLVKPGQERAYGTKRAAAEPATDPGVPLIAEHEIVNLPSASVIGVLRRETSDRRPPSKWVAVLADPVFDAGDPRVDSSSGTRNTPAPASPRAALNSVSAGAAARTANPRVSVLQELRRSLGLLRQGLGVPRLPGTRHEADSIMAWVPDGEGRMATGFQASRAAATDPQLSQYRIVHFATHGLLDDKHPELSGLVLSLVDERGRPQNGFLRLHDIYNLNLPVELVVLSACNSGVGKEVRGEGLIGIVRGFMYAGAKRVVASLWKVDDEATAELMKRFYRHMLQGGLRPAAALRAAQVEMWQQKRWHSPYHWAAFVLQGEWK